MSDTDNVVIPFYAMNDETREVSNGKKLLAEFVELVKHNQPICEDILRFVADGVERHLANPSVNPWPKCDNGRPAEYVSSKIKARSAAEVQFYRRMLPELDGRRPMKQAALALQLGYSETNVKSIRELEKSDESIWDSPYFEKRIEDLIAKTDGLADVYHVRGHLVRGTPSLIIKNRDGTQRIFSLTVTTEEKVRYEASLPKQEPIEFEVFNRGTIFCRSGEKGKN